MALTKIGKEGITGIDNSSNATAITIDSSENVGIGLSSNIDRKLHVQVDGDYAVKFGGTGSGDYAIEIGQAGASGSAGLNATGNQGAMKFAISGTEAMRIDPNRNFLVGKTSSGVANDGFEAQLTGQTVITQASADVLRLNRKTSDGTIIDLRKDGTTVGSIGSEGGDSLYIVSGDTGLRFSGGADVIIPVTTGGAARDNAITLGSSGARIKDIYLSGGIYMQGSTTAVQFDDYEEGTVNLAYSSVSSSFNYTHRKCYYTKVGNRVHISVNMQLDGSQTLSANTVTITGLPFTSVNDSAHQASACCRVRYFNFSSGYTYLTATVGSNTTEVSLMQNGDNVANQAAVANQLSNVSGQVMFTLSYTAA